MPAAVYGPGAALARHVCTWHAGLTCPPHSRPQPPVGVCKAQTSVVREPLKPLDIACRPTWLLYPSLTKGRALGRVLRHVLVPRTTWCTASVWVLPHGHGAGEKPSFATAPRNGQTTGKSLSFLQFSAVRKFVHRRRDMPYCRGLSFQVLRPQFLCIAPYTSYGRPVSVPALHAPIAS